MQKFVPVGVGRLCEWKHKTVDMAAESSTFMDYKQTLNIFCDSGEPGEFIWTPDKNTPDLVYYQCYTHKNLGWKIHVTGNSDRLHPLLFMCLVLAVVPIISQVKRK
ncbi:protein Skeletor, isoforms B/C-like [Limulus polyphemus]|uniref:Protein Skeletor, isoforms B/C-like n=1 Tax=Limulus polyphemus TaxID=6850 RepID=A0ABM1S2R8_LIMPO|nr:protein Skeletor, isoforms B/C-like [Limulus polyphemus]